MVASGADLRKANLTSADLRRANLTSANLSGANLTGADLRKANFTGVNLTSSYWPTGIRIPAGWQRTPGSGRLERAGH
jgi:hypothetical protein